MGNCACSESNQVCSQDGGDPAVEVSPRDIMYRLPAEEAEACTSAEAHVLAQTDLRWAALEQFECVCTVPVLASQGSS